MMIMLLLKKLKQFVNVCINNFQRFRYKIINFNNFAHQLKIIGYE